jgi:hypothetical protein
VRGKKGGKKNETKNTVMRDVREVADLFTGTDAAINARNQTPADHLEQDQSRPRIEDLFVRSTIALIFMQHSLATSLARRSVIGRIVENIEKREIDVRGEAVLKLDEGRVKFRRVYGCL